MAARKLNLVELHGSVKVGEDGRGTAVIGQEQITQGRLRALKVVPIIMHLDYMPRQRALRALPGACG